MILEWLETFYSLSSKGKHYFQIKIETIDNPGWTVLIETEDTAFESIPKNRVYEKNVSDDNWIFLKIEDDKLVGACGPNNLAEMLNVIKSWYEEQGLVGK